MKIYIEHIDGRFNDLSEAGWERTQHYKGGSIYSYSLGRDIVTDKRDFEIGSRVYFQSVGWTEVVGREGGCIASGCAFERSCEHCLDDVLCLADEREEAVKFVSIETKRESVRTTSDYNNVDHPKHYTDVVPGIECIQVTEHFDFLLGNAIKYIWRSGRKGENTALQDLKKAEWYIKRAIAREEGK